jgi:hypothetical protein
MADLTLRRVKQDPLTHDELDDNFIALDSDIRAGNFDSGLSVSGDIELIDGNLILNDGDIHYNPKLGFFDMVDSNYSFFIDSGGDFVRGDTNIKLNGIFIDSNAPTNPHQGDMWLNRSVNRLYIWDGTVWFQEP